MNIKTHFDNELVLQLVKKAVESAKKINKQKEENAWRNLGRNHYHYFLPEWTDDSHYEFPLEIKEMEVSSKRVHCSYCGQWGERYHVCAHCGAPID